MTGRGAIRFFRRAVGTVGRIVSAGASAVLIGVVRAYQGTLSPIVGRHCRFQPTCSHYFIQAVRARGPAVGAALGIWRILRCHPFSRGGYDPVPEGKTRGHRDTETRGEEDRRRYGRGTDERG